MVMGWMVASPFILAALYMIFLPVFKFLLQKFSSVPLSPKKPLLSHSEIKLKTSLMGSGTATRSSPMDTDDDY
ncbi:hypothetical protein Pint_07222 [Pistacia integerrima]|uniref:Uncharacterized protein n=1 Tax=Pistacia integerrima TaxID=434235 RepID=A0ACC0XZH9_9ROSI|nr:hypothetical protein Pint_07222 [Pistacia integerrima]